MSAEVISEKKFMLAGLMLGGIFLFWITRPGNAAKLGFSFGKAAVDTVTGAAGGVVVAAGDVVGIPATNASQCRIDLVNGDIFKASFSCSAPDYLNYITTGTLPK